METPGRRKLLVVSVVIVLAAAVVAVALGLPTHGRHPPPELPPDEAGSGAPSVPPTSRGKERALIWAVGDGANGGTEPAALASRIAATRPSHFLYLGDVYEDGTAEEFERNYKALYARLDPITAPTPGNHDWPNAGSGYNAYWSEVRGRPMPSYYAFRAGGWELLSLNSEARHDETSQQVRWLRRKVSKAGSCRVAFWHRPRFSAGKHGDQEDVDPLWRALRGRAKIVLSGHDHNMQRLRSMDGTTQFVSGAGGKSHYEIDASDRRLAFGDDRRDGALRLELRPGVARYAFVSSSGEVLDSGDVRCREGP